MKSRTASGLTKLVGEIIHAICQVGVKVTKVYNMVVDKEKIPRDGEPSALLHIYKEKGGPLECGPHRTMKVFERALERRKVNINGMQSGFMPRKGMTDGIFAV